MVEIACFLVGIVVGGIIMFLVARNNKKKFFDALNLEAADVVDRINRRLGIKK